MYARRQLQALVRRNRPDLREITPDLDACCGETLVLETQAATVRDTIIEGRRRRIPGLGVWIGRRPVSLFDGRSRRPYREPGPRAAALGVAREVGDGPVRILHVEV